MTAPQGPAVPPVLRRSQHLSLFAHMGAVYLYHDLHGFLLEMSPDIVALIDAFSGGADTQEVLARFRGTFGDADPAQFVDVFIAHAVLVEPDDDELEGIWPMVPIKARWNVWRRRGDRMTIWTAWGDAPVAQVELDADETRMWDAFDGEKRLAELRSTFDRGKLAALVRRLVHSDVQALRLGHMPMSTYAKRPGLAPRYLSSTMPYRRWKPGDPLPGVAGGAEAPAPTDYYQSAIDDADLQFDHQETTLSHLFRNRHPALRGRTYGQALVDGIAATALPSSGAIRVLEIGGGLGYVARDVIGRLRERDLDVTYTIVELAPRLAAAQRERLAGLPVTWHAGSVLELELPAGGFDLIVANEMVGDLPARQLSRLDVGLALDGGEVDAQKLAALGRTGELVAQLGIHLDDAPEPFYLQTGAFELMIRVARWLAPGGTAVVTEFGGPMQWPRLSTQLDHPELSTHFGHLVSAVRALGLDGRIEFVIDVLDLDRAEQGLATTRSQFRALAAMLAAEGVTIEKVGYTPALFAQALGDKVPQDQIGELRWDRIEDRLMGLVPHEFKALIATKPRA
jgi:protein-L-isoaspartate O-methyltransferase